MDTIGNTKQISDYLHLYLGCEIEHDKGIYRGTLVGIGSGFLTAEIDCDFFKRNTHGHKVPKGKDFGTYNIQMWRLKPILRKLSDMTEQEYNTMWELLGWNEKIKGNQRAVDIIKEFEQIEPDCGGNANWGYFTKIFPYMLKHGFDLFGLIEAGLAINKTKLEK